MTDSNPYFSDGLIDEINKDVIGIAPGFAAAQTVISAALASSRDQLSMGHMMQLSAIVALAETARQLNGGVRRGSTARAVNEALDLLRQALAPERD